MIIGTAGSAMSEFGRKLVRGMWAIGEVEPIDQQSPSRRPCVGSDGRDTRYGDAKVVDQSFAVVPS